MIVHLRRQIDAFGSLWPSGILGVLFALCAAAVPFVFDGATIAWGLLAIVVLVPLMGVDFAHRALPQA